MDIDCRPNPIKSGNQQLRRQEEGERESTYTTRNITTVRSSNSSSYRSFSSGFSGASRATTAFSSPEPFEAGSTGMGWISETTRAAPIGRADEGAIDSVQTASALCSFTLTGAVVSDTLTTTRMVVLRNTRAAVQSKSGGEKDI